MKLILGQELLIMQNFGYTLVEVILALLLISLGGFAVFSLQANALHSAESMYWHNVAIIQAQSLMEVLLVNQDSFARKNELNNWRAVISSMLPRGTGFYQCSGFLCQVTVEWQDMQKQNVSLKRELNAYS
jgi:Tfp pilus assembly protein PilV